MRLASHATRGQSRSLRAVYSRSPGCRLTLQYAVQPDLGSASFALFSSSSPRGQMHSTYGATDTNDVETPPVQDARPGAGRGLYLVLPVALFCSMGMAATSATTIFAYETLLCKDPRDCSPDEKERYSATVALSAAIANFCAIVALWLLPLLPQGNPKASLYFWLASRASSVAVLAIGGLF